MLMRPMQAGGRISSQFLFLLSGILWHDARVVYSCIHPFKHPWAPFSVDGYKPWGTCCRVNLSLHVSKDQGCWVMWRV